jgi:hypothetical protein
MRTDWKRDRSNYFEKRRFRVFGVCEFVPLLVSRLVSLFALLPSGQSMNAHYSAVLLRDDRNAMPDAMEADAAAGENVRPRTRRRVSDARTSRR